MGNGAFGASGEGFARACYATSLEQIKTAMDRIEEFLGENKKVKKRPVAAVAAA